MALSPAPSPAPSPSKNELVLPHSDVESQLSSLVQDLLQRVQVAAEDMLKMINEIGENSSAVTAGVMNCKNVGIERKRTLEEEKEYVQKAAYATLNMLNNQEIS